MNVGSARLFVTSTGTLDNRDSAPSLKMSGLVPDDVTGSIIELLTVCDEDLDSNNAATSLLDNFSSLDALNELIDNNLTDFVGMFKLAGLNMILLLFNMCLIQLLDAAEH